MNSFKVQSRTNFALCSRCQRRGLTVVELLAATILAAMLMAAVLGVLRSLTRERKVLIEEAPVEAWTVRLSEQLEWDLTNSRIIQSTSEGILLSGFAGRDFAHAGALHCRTSVRYAIVKTGNHSCLLRFEAHPDSLNVDNQVGQLVCTNVDRMALGSTTTERKAVNGQAQAGTAPKISDGPIPDHIVVALYQQNQTMPIFQHEFHLR